MSVLPIKLLPLTVTTITPTAFWTEDDGSGDPWIGNPYQWEIIAVVSTQTHSSNQTPTPYVYDGLDIDISMWVGDVGSGTTVEIISITSQTSNSITMIVEDIERFNTFSDPSQNGIGIGGTGSWFAFEMSDEGLPILSPMTSASGQLILNVAFQQDVIGRHEYRNLIKNYVAVNQPGHTFLNTDQIILTNSGDFIKAQANTNDINYIIGTVTSIGIPGVEWFTYRPHGKIIDLVLVGNPGDVYYVSPTIPGSYTNTKPVSYDKPVFIKLSSSKVIELNRPVEPEIITTLDIVPTNAQTVFTLPSNAREIITITVNGLEVSEFTYAAPTLTFDPNDVGYSFEVSDEMKIIYHN